jgi:hypothetical protein
MGLRGRQNGGVPAKSSLARPEVGPWGSGEARDDNIRRIKIIGDSYPNAMDSEGPAPCWEPAGGVS